MLSASQEQLFVKICHLINEKKTHTIIILKNTTTLSSLRNIDVANIIMNHHQSW